MQEWLECLSRIRRNKIEKNIYVCISQCYQALSSKLGLEGDIKPPESNKTSQASFIKCKFMKIVIFSNKLITFCFFLITDSLKS